MSFLCFILSFFMALFSLEGSNIQGSISNERLPHKEVNLQKGDINKQLSQENTTYIISRRYDLKEMVKGVSLDAPIKVNGQRYYIHSKHISLAEGQLIWIPKRCVLLNEDKEVLLTEGTYRPQSQCNVFIASNNRRTVS